jgi:ATP-binding cassette subfamily C (CFTR/MRP) protein 1
MADICDVAVDRKFGPGVQCSQFDFTLTFEQSIFGIGISTIFLLLFPVRAKQLFCAPIKTTQHPIYLAKIVNVKEVLP